MKAWDEKRSGLLFTPWVMVSIDLTDVTLVSDDTKEDLTDVTLVSEDTFWRLDWCDPGE